MKVSPFLLFASCLVISSVSIFANAQDIEQQQDDDYKAELQQELYDILAGKQQDEDEMEPAKTSTYRGSMREIAMKQQDDDYKAELQELYEILGGKQDESDDDDDEEEMEPVARRQKIGSVFKKVVSKGKSLLTKAFNSFTGRGGRGGGGGGGGGGGYSEVVDSEPPEEVSEPEPTPAPSKSAKRKRRPSQAKNGRKRKGKKTKSAKQKQGTTTKGKGTVKKTQTTTSKGRGSSKKGKVRRRG